MKIGVITDSISSQNASAEGAIALTRAIIELGYAATLYASESLPGNFTEGGNARGVPVVSLPSDFHLTRVSALERARGLSQLVSDFIDEHRRAHALASLLDPHLDALIIYGGKGYRSARSFKKQRHAKIPALWYVDTLPFYFYTYCDIGVQGGAPWCSPAKKILYRILDFYERRVSLSAITHLVGISREVQRLLKRYSNRDALVVGPGVASFAAVQEKDSLSGRAVEVLFYGEHIPLENVGEIVAPLKTLHDLGYRVSLVVLGDTKDSSLFRLYREALLERAKEYGIDETLSFPGGSGRESARECFGSADIFVHLYGSAEGEAILFEALAAGIPAIVLEPAVSNTVLTDGKTALLLKTIEPSTIAGALKNLIDDEQLCRQLRGGGQALVRDFLSWRHVAETFVAMLTGEKKA